MKAPCPDCDGSGVTWAYPPGEPYEPKPTPGYRECQTCRGEGKVRVVSVVLHHGRIVARDLESAA